MKISIPYLAKQLHFKFSVACKAYCTNENDLFADYLNDCQDYLKRACLSHPPLLAMLLNTQEEIKNDTQQSERPGKFLLDYSYLLMTVHPFLTWIKRTHRSPTQSQKLERLSRYLQTFQQYYRHMGITPQNRQQVGRTTSYPPASSCKCWDVRGWVT